MVLAVLTRSILVSFNTLYLTGDCPVTPAARKILFALKPRIISKRHEIITNDKMVQQESVSRARKQTQRSHWLVCVSFSQLLTSFLYSFLDFLSPYNLSIPGLSEFPHLETSPSTPLVHQHFNHDATLKPPRSPQVDATNTGQITHNCTPSFSLFLLLVFSSGLTDYSSPVDSSLDSSLFASMSPVLALTGGDVVLVQFSRHL